MMEQQNYPSGIEWKNAKHKYKLEIAQISVAKDVRFLHPSFCLLGDKVNLGLPNKKQFNELLLKLLHYIKSQCLAPKSQAYEAKEENKDLTNINSHTVPESPAD